MEFDNSPEIRKENETNLRKYWGYLESKRSTVDDSLLGEADIANIFVAPEDVNE
jgi:hypothetical protein